MKYIRRFNEEKPDEKTVEFEYPGYMSKEAEDFFKGNVKREENNGGTSVGSFVKLENGKTVLPSKGDVFTKNKEGKIKLIRSRQNSEYI